MGATHGSEIDNVTGPGRAGRLGQPLRVRGVFGIPTVGLRPRLLTAHRCAVKDAPGSSLKRASYIVAALYERTAVTRRYNRMRNYLCRSL